MQHSCTGPESVWRIAHTPRAGQYVVQNHLDPEARTRCAHAKRVAAQLAQAMPVLLLLKGG